ncbi:MAG: hypothetical protein ABI353_08545 [Isosphaeraceae bacterium]
MASKDYTLHWIIDPTKAVSGAQAIERELLNLERIADRLGPKLKNVAAGVSRSMGSATRATRALGSQLLAVGNTANGTGTALNGVGTAAGSIRGNFKAASSSGRSVAGSLLAIGAAYKGIQLVAEVGEALAESLDKAREFARETAEQNLKLRDSMRELKNLQGGSQSSDDVARAHLEFRAATGTTDKEAEAFQSEYLGAVDASRDRWEATHDAQGKPIPGTREMGMRPGIEGDLGVEAATFGVRTGMDAPTAGKLTGLLGEYGKIGSVEEGAKVLGGIGHHLNIEGVGKVAALAKDFTGLLADFSGEDGRIPDPVQAAAVFSVATRRNKSGAKTATSMRQANRLMRKAAFSDDEEVKALGITEDDDFLQSLRKIAPMATGKGADKWMMDHKIGRNSTERDAVIKLAKMLPSIDVALNDPDAKVTAAGTIAANKQFLATDPAALNRIAETRRDQAKDTRGMAARDFAVLSKLAEADLLNNKEIETRESNTQEALQDILAPGFVRGALGIENARQRKTNNRIAGNILGSVPNASARFPGMFSDNGRGGITINNPNSEEVTAAINALSPEERAKLRQRMDKDAAPLGGTNPGLKLPASGKGAPGISGVGAKGQGGHASISAPEIKEAGQVMMQAAQAMLAASRSASPASSGGSHAPGTSDLSGFGPVRS